MANDKNGTDEMLMNCTFLELTVQYNVSCDQILDSNRIYIENPHDMLDPTNNPGIKSIQALDPKIL
jgi:hypothetical protein